MGSAAEHRAQSTERTAAAACRSSNPLRRLSSEASLLVVCHCQPPLHPVHLQPGSSKRYVVCTVTDAEGRRGGIVRIWWVPLRLAVALVSNQEHRPPSPLPLLDTSRAAQRAKDPRTTLFSTAPPPSMHGGLASLLFSEAISISETPGSREAAYHDATLGLMIQ